MCVFFKLFSLYEEKNPQNKSEENFLICPFYKAKNQNILTLHVVWASQCLCCVNGYFLLWTLDSTEILKIIC